MNKLTAVDNTVTVNYRGVDLSFQWNDEVLVLATDQCGDIWAYEYVPKVDFDGDAFDSDMQGFETPVYYAEGVEVEDWEHSAVEYKVTLDG